MEDTSQIERTNKNELNKTSKSHECYTNLKPVLSNCSCPECDSLECFIRRELTNNHCNCKDKSQSCYQYCNKNGNKTTQMVNKEAKFCDEISYQQKVKTVNGNIDKTLQFKFSCKSITDISQENCNIDVDNSPVRIPIKKLSNTTAELSAQIMNVSFEDFNESILINQPNRDSLTQLSDKKQDILSRIKEIYKACSCKVCECIPIKSFFTPSDTCSCKPCQCSECRNVRNIKDRPHHGCPCIRCDRKDCGGVTKNILWNQTCDCKPCDCLQCTDFLSKNCDCEPCSCLECKSKNIHFTNSFVVALVEQNAQGGNCNCDAPCECSNCVPNYGTGTLQDRSTGTATISTCPCDTCVYDLCQSNEENCRCEIQKGIMTKPIQRNRHDYDIRNVSIKEPLWSNKQREKYQKEMNVDEHLIMQDLGQHLLNKMCQCASCECYVCNKYSYEDTTNKHSSRNRSFCCNDLKFTRSDKIHYDLALRKIIPTSDSFSNSYEYFNILKDENNIGIPLINNNKHRITPLQTSNVFSEDISSTTQLKSRKNTCVCQTFSQYTCCFNQNNKHNIHDNNSSRSIFYATAHNSSLSINLKKDVKVKRQNTELSLPRRKKLYCVASILKDMSLFNQDSNNSSFESKDSKYSSSNMLLSSNLHAVVPTLKCVPERLDKSLNYELSSVKSNYFMKSSCIKYFNALFDENQKITEDNDNTFDYGKIFKTLREAQDFSVKLKRILEIYEEANNNFISVSQRLKVLYEEMFQKNESGFCTYLHKVHLNDNSDFKETCCVGDTQLLSHEQDIISSNLNVSASTSRSSNSKMTTLKPNLGSHNLFENVECMEFQESESVERYEDAFNNDVIFEDLNKNNGSSFNKKFDLLRNRFKSKGQNICADLRKNSKLISNNHDYYLQKHDNYTIADASFLNTRLSIYDRSVGTENDHSKQDKHLNTTITISFRDADFYKDTGVETCNNLQTIYNNNYEYIDVIPKKINKKMENNVEFEKWNVLRKNLFLKSETQKHDIPLLELKLKEFIGMISEEIRTEYTEQETLNCCKSNKNVTEEKIYENVRTFLNQLVSAIVLKSELRSIKRNSITSTLKQSPVKIESMTTKESVKAIFSDLRRISDHTVLVKWIIPKNISNIRGYELQVDGRALRKVFNPNSSMAVVTCLPHNDKVLLTILTLSRSNDSYNSNTIVYHPRKKTK